MTLEERVEASARRGSMTAITLALQDAPPESDESARAEYLGKLLLIATEHDPKFGPPHDLDEAEVRRLLGGRFDIEILGREDRMVAEPQWKKRGATRFPWPKKNVFNYRFKSTGEKSYWEEIDDPDAPEDLEKEPLAANPEDRKWIAEPGSGGLKPDGTR